MPEDKGAAERLGLEPMQRLDLANVSSTSDLMQRLSKTAFSARSLGEAVDVAEAMVRDESWVVLTMSGAMTMAGLSLVAVEMIERGWVDCVVATGALVGHGLTEEIGERHYKADPAVPDEQYFEMRLNRVYDVIEPEENLDRLEQRLRGLFSELAEDRGEADPLGTHELLRYFGQRIPGRGVLQAAAASDVPVYIPAFTDSELALDFAVFNEARKEKGLHELRYDAFRDLHHYAKLCQGQAEKGRKLGIFTVGGGVPRNWTQQVGPFIDVSNHRLERTWTVPRFSYGIRICPDPVHYGHLSGSTYSEAVSWGKFVPRSQGGRFAEVPLDATVAWPLIVRGLIERGL